MNKEVKIFFVTLSIVLCLIQPSVQKSNFVGDCGGYPEFLGEWATGCFKVTCSPPTAPSVIGCPLISPPNCAAPKTMKTKHETDKVYPDCCAAAWCE